MGTGVIPGEGLEQRQGDEAPTRAGRTCRQRGRRLGPLEEGCGDLEW